MPVYTTYNCLGLDGGGYRDLDSVSIDDLNANDRAIVMDTNGEMLFFEFDAADSSTAENLTSRPYVVYPNDRTTIGCWKEQIYKPVGSTENLLTNSGFGVWSNSELAQGEDQGRQTGYEVGSALVTGTDADFSGAGNWSLGATWSITSGVLRASATTNNATLALSGLTVGKLYKVKINCDAYTGGTLSFGAIDNGETTWLGRLATITPVASEDLSVIWEATETNNKIRLDAETSLTADFDDADVHEVTPACLGADPLGPDGWYKTTTLDLHRQHNDGGTLTKDGSFYSCKMTKGADGAEWLAWPTGINSTDEFTQKFASRTATLGAWIKSSDGSGDNIRLCVREDSTYTYSSYHTGGGAWEWLEVTYTFTASPGTIYFIVDNAGDTDDVAYISQPMLIFGDYIGEGNYVQPPREWIFLEDTYWMLSFDGDDFSDVGSTTTINMEAETSGMIPKGAKGFVLTGSHSDSGGGSNLYFYLYGSDTDWYAFASFTQVTANALNAFTAVINTDDGDIGYQVNASGSPSMSIYMMVTAVLVSS